MTIYAVTSGAYSDYDVDALFSTKELADKYIKLHEKLGMKIYGGYDIKEYILDLEPDEYITIHGKYDIYEDRIISKDYGRYNAKEYIGWNKIDSRCVGVYCYAIPYNSRLEDDNVLLKAIRDRYYQFKYEQGVSK